MEFLDTGINNFNRLIKEGIPKGSIILLAGPTGSGKTIFASQFIANCISKYKHNCLYLSFEEHKDSIERNFENFSWKLDSTQKKKLTILKYNPYEFTAVTDILSRHLKKYNIDTVILDSLTGLDLYTTEQKDLKNTLTDIQTILKENNCTAIITSQIQSDSYSMNRLGFEEALADGVMMMYYKNINIKYIRGLSIWKMRGMAHKSETFPYEIGKDGIKINQR